MGSGKAVNANVVIADPVTGSPVFIEAGEVPDAKYRDLLGDHLFVQQEEPGVPPRSGKGSGATAWATYAAAHGVTVDDPSDREAVIEALTATGVPTE